MTLRARALRLRIASTSQHIYHREKDEILRSTCRQLCAWDAETCCTYRFENIKTVVYDHSGMRAQLPHS